MVRGAGWSAAPRAPNAWSRHPHIPRPRTLSHNLRAECVVCEICAERRAKRSRLSRIARACAQVKKAGGALKFVDPGAGGTAGEGFWPIHRLLFRPPREVNFIAWASTA